jgi:hypothetical protein
LAVTPRTVTPAASALASVSWKLSTPPSVTCASPMLTRVLSSSRMRPVAAPPAGVALVALTIDAVSVSSSASSAASSTDGTGSDPVVWPAAMTTSKFVRAV